MFVVIKGLSADILGAIKRPVDRSICIKCTRPGNSSKYVLDNMVKEINSERKTILNFYVEKKKKIQKDMIPR